jgi:GAF domain-containing protein/HAMP domain-containing protein
MNKSDSNSFLSRLLYWAGGYYIVSVIALAQFIVTPLGIVLAALILFFNAEFTVAQLTSVALFTGGSMLIRNVLLLLSLHVANRDAVVRLGKWKRGEELSSTTSEESRAWRQITTLSWRYTAIAFSTLMVFIMIPTLFYVKTIIQANQDQIIYTFFSGTVAGISLALLEVLLLERMLIPARNVLLPSQFNNQIKGVLGFRLLHKFTLVMVALIIVSALLITPIGYHQTVTVLYEEIGSLKVLTNLQVQSVIVVIFAVLVGLGLSFLLARSISQPVNQMIDVFQKVELGDLSQRVKVTATDEVGELAVHFNNMANRLEDLQMELENRVAERTEQLRTTIEVGQVANSILEPSELISRVVNLITERFGYYYAAIFLVDSTNRWAELKDATGEAGKILKSQNHHLEIGGMSMVSSAITKREARVALDVGIEPVRFDNPVLTQTRSEIALPLMIGDHVIGALDVQSTEEAAFDQENIITLQGMANQVAIALENARLFQQTQQNLEELRAAHRLYVTDAWSGISHERNRYDYSIKGEAESPESPTKTVEVPITLHEQSIGSLSLEGRQDWTPEERNLIEAVASQAALALENARLLEESQQLALRERLVAEITGKIWASPSTDLILQTAIKEIGRALRADEVTINLE